VTLDILLLDKFNEPVDHDDVGDTIANLVRMFSVNQYYHGMVNVFTTMLTFPNVNYRYLLEPSGHYPKTINLLNFSNHTTWPMQENGREDAQTCLAQGDTCGFGDLDALIKEHEQDHKDSSVGAFATYLAGLLQ
jgi:hypothetical protein